MPSNIVHAPARCPACGAEQRMAWEFAFGALAGEELELGQRVPFDEPYSFYAQRRGSPEGHHEVEATALCPACDAELHATLAIDDGILRALSAPASGD